MITITVTRIYDLVLEIRVTISIRHTCRSGVQAGKTARWSAADYLATRVEIMHGPDEIMRGLFRGRSSNNNNV
jgi:hypothetical protein